MWCHSMHYYSNICAFINSKPNQVLYYYNFKQVYLFCVCVLNVCFLRKVEIKGSEEEKTFIEL